MDEAGSRARIRAFYARRPGGAADALAALQELHEVQDAKAQAVKVCAKLTTDANRSGATGKFYHGQKARL